MSGADPEVTITGIAAGGDGVARLPDGRVVFVPRTAVGDRVRLRSVRHHARFSRAAIEALVDPGPGRTEPPCPHYDGDRCGGCQLMHLTADAQRVAKQRIAGDAVRRIAKVEVADPGITAAPDQLGYRSKVTFAVRHGRIGYHRLHEPDSVFDVERCLIAHPLMQRLHAALRAARALLPPETTTVVLRADRGGRAHLIVATGAGNAWTGAPALAAALAGHGVDAVIWWHPESGAPRAMAGADDAWPATVFEQVYPAMGDMVRASAIAALGDVGGKTVWDLYAGIGETSAALARRGARVESVERDQTAVHLAERLDPGAARRHAGSAEDLIGSLPEAQLVVTNPPRVGMAPAVSAALRRSGAARIVYISCDPATLARDLGRLAPEFRLSSLEIFDQFPQTAHLESVAVLERT